jgi:UDPglucose--hexose-1-phosphate uridylyltransferase
MSEFRRDPIIGRWVIISSERGRRPNSYIKEQDAHKDGPCPFCAGNEKLTPPEILRFQYEPQDSKFPWGVRVVSNKFPALAVEGNLDRKGEGMYDKMNGVGAHEVIIETPEHDKKISDMHPKHIENIIWAYKERIIDLKRDFRLEYILIFKNQGQAAGATLSHPHSQLIATPVVPKRVIEEVRGAKSYFENKERCPFCDIIAQEMADTKRIVAENDAFIAFCPFASRFPFEVWIMPKNHSSNFEYITREDAAHLSMMMKDVLSKLSQVLDNPSYNYIIHNAPLKDNNLAHFHWHIEIMPKLTQVAGFEWGTGFYINPTPPEEAAQFLRESD